MKLFYDLFYWKKFQKFLIVNFRLLKNFLLLNSLKKNSKIFYSQFHWKKISKIFQKIRKKSFCLKKKRSQEGGNAPFFPVKSDTTFHWVLTYHLQKYPQDTKNLQKVYRFKIFKRIIWLTLINKKQLSMKLCIINLLFLFYIYEAKKSFFESNISP